MAHLKLEDAYLCLDCEMIGSNPETCVVCTSRAVYPLAKFLNRPTSCRKNMGNDLLIIPCDLPKGHSGNCERNIWPVTVAEQIDYPAGPMIDTVLAAEERVRNG